MDRTNIVSFAQTTWPVVADHFSYVVAILGSVWAVAWAFVKCYQVEAKQ